MKRLNFYAFMALLTTGRVDYYLRSTKSEFFISPRNLQMEVVPFFDFQESQNLDFSQLQEQIEKPQSDFASSKRFISAVIDQI
jgi:hypothetical protein